MPPPETISDIYVAHRHRLEAVARRIVGCPHAAADLAQDSWAHAAAAPGLIENPIGFLHRVTRNLALDWRRRRLGHSCLPLDALTGEAADPAPGPERIVSGRERLDRVSGAIADLPPRCREAFLLARLDGLSYAAIAKRMEISPRTVENHVAFAMVRLRESVKSVW